MNLLKPNYRLGSKYDFESFEIGEERHLAYNMRNVRSACCMWVKRKKNGWKFATAIEGSGTRIKRVK